MADEVTTTEAPAAEPASAPAAPAQAAAAETAPSAAAEGDEEEGGDGDGEEGDDDDDDDQLFSELFEALHDSLSAQQKRLLKDDGFVKRAGGTQSAKAIRDELNLNVYELLKGCAAICADMADALEEAEVEIEEMKQIVSQHDTILRGLVSGSIINLCISLAGMVLARPQVDDEMRRLASAVMTAVASAGQAVAPAESQAAVAAVPAEAPAASAPTPQAG